MDGDVLLGEGERDADWGRVFEGRYRLGNRIGEGGMGRVYEATRLGSGDTVAVKLLRPEVASARVRKRFEREAQAMASMHHPGVVRLIEFGHASDGNAFLVMERLRGPTLADLRRAGKFAAPGEAVDAIRAVAEVVGAAHEAGIVHRDLKPANVILHRDCGGTQVKVLDFGIARILDEDAERLTSSGDMIGTLAYMAPEQGFGRPVTPAADVYSLGVMLFEALAGKVPFDIRSPVEFLRQQSGAPAPAVSSFREDVSAALDDLVGRCLARLPENRYPDARPLARELAGVPVQREAEDGATVTRAVRVNPSRWVGTILEGSYELHEWLSPGRFGSNVYLATHLRTMARVAVRLWETRTRSSRDRVIEAFRAEARAMGVRHPNLIAVLDLGFPDNGVYLVTELVESTSLRTLLAGKGPLAPSTAAGLAEGVAEALAALHERDIRSGGMSPETLRVTGTPDRPERLLLSPFGLTSLRQIESLLGGPGTSDADPVLEYLAPQQRDGAVPDAGSDLYSLALVLLEMMTGRAPSELQATLATARPVPAAAAVPGDLPERWRSFFRRALSHDPARRFDDAGKFAAAMRSAAAPGGPRASRKRGARTKGSSIGM